MALPADILFPMNGHIHCRHPLTGRNFIMALSTEFPCIRFCRRYGSRRGPMLYRDLMANGAFQRGMIGGHLGPLNLRMTGCAVTGRLRRVRVMRIVTGDTGLPRVVRIRIDLWEARWP